MELTCALVFLVQVSFVISNPYGYGPRTAASAKADASAVAGAYGGAGSLPVPQGTGYSGSFSKSYSSSNAASSASSSASASSFSYSGSGSGGLPFGRESGCSGDCNGAKESTGSQALNDNVAFPGQDVGTGQYKNGGSRNEPKTLACGSGNCPSGKGSGSYGSSGSLNTFSGANAVATTGAGQTGSTYSQDKASPNRKPNCQGSDCDSSSNDRQCSTGKCEPNGGSNAGIDAKCTSDNCDTNTRGESTSSEYGTNGKCTSGQCGSQFVSPSNEYGSNDIKVKSLGNVKSNYGGQTAAPITNYNSGCKYGKCDNQLNLNPSYTPEYPPCTSPDCNNYGQGPSSTPGSQGYNKPSINLSTPKQCTSPNCQPASAQTNGYPSTNFVALGQNTFTSPSTPCVGSYCNQGLTKAPYSTQSVASSLVPNGPSGCASGNCNSSPSTQSPGGYGKPFSAYGNTAAHSTLPASGPACSPGSPNCNGEVVSIGPASSCLPGSGPCNDAFFGEPKSEIPASGPSCTPGSPGCNAQIPPNYSGSPLYTTHPLKHPMFAGGSYTPTGTLPSSSPAYQPGQTSTGLPSGHYGMASAYNTPKPGGCNTPNCAEQTAVTNPHLNPIGAIPSSENMPNYNGGFRGPAGILKPNEFKVPSSLFNPSAASNTPSINNPAVCSTGNCGPQSNASPTYGSSPWSQTAPAVGANIPFGGPSGISKPNEFSAPSSAYNKPGTQPACSTGNCGLPGASPSYSTGGSTAPASSASASANAVAYTGGFGGPPGILKPNDGGKGDFQLGKPQVSHQGSYSNNGVGSQQGLNSNNGQASHQGPSSNNGLGSHQGSYSNNGLGSHQGSYSNNGLTSQQGTSSNNGLGSHQGSYSNNGLGSHQGSYSNNGVGSQAQANAVASATAGAYGGNGGYGSQADGGCGGGCGTGGGSLGGAPSAGSYGAAPSGGSYGGGSYGGNRGGVKYDSGLGGQQATGSSAKSLAGSSGYGGNYASSSASAHATSGAAIKGSYGK